jgi:hypothetical protein
MKNKKIELKVVYDDIIDGTYVDGWFEINGVKVKNSGRIEMNPALDILEHLGYLVTLVKSDIKDEQHKP